MSQTQKYKFLDILNLFSFYGLLLMPLAYIFSAASINVIILLIVINLIVSSFIYKNFIDSCLLDYTKPAKNKIKIIGSGTIIGYNNVIVPWLGGIGLVYEH
jgi:hypothetical protein